MSAFLLAIAIIERGNVPGDITIMKIEAIQLGYLCCVQLDNSQKQREFEHQLSELGIPIPDPDQAKNEVLTFVKYIIGVPHNVCTFNSCFV